jgi:hypothetical protein
LAHWTEDVSRISCTLLTLYNDAFCVGIEQERLATPFYKWNNYRYMRRVFTSTLVLVFVLVVLVTLALIVGHSSPVSSRVTQLHLTDCQLPCWAKVRLGQKVEEVEQELRTYSANAGYQMQAYPEIRRVLFLMPIHVTDRVEKITVQLFFDPTYLSAISISCISSDKNKFSMPTLGEVMNLYGLPVCVMHTSDDIYLLFSSENTTVRVKLATPSFELGRSVDTIDLLMPGNSRCESQRMYRWQGFNLNLYPNIETK